ncbi:rod shape-determining protein RodA [Treponema lecithinolyticum]|uniref:rod shape-determining protein RodA n=2 Tax=Treponema lecithinolyticum TaxID=53418 RepID=UPI0028E2BF75|nr:rod shape-determining protein RodA [Treponema lecithinolyticum]
MKLRFFEIFDYLLLICVTLLVVMGISFIYSSGVNSNQISVSNEYIKQLVFACTGLVIMFFAALVDYRKLKRLLPMSFAGLIAVLLYTIIFGKYVNGARSWIGIGNFGIQPSEFGKIIYILFFAYYLEQSENTAALKRFFISCGILALPSALILLQPDMGTASVYIPIFLAMLFAAGFPLKYILFILFTGISTIILTILPVWQEAILQKQILALSVLTDTKLRLIVITTLTIIAVISSVGYLFYKNKYYYWLAWLFGALTLAFAFSVAGAKVLKDYQIKRLIVFLNPYTDPLGSGWNIIQSKIAIGSGGIFGQGFLKGTQSHYRFLPQQSTDFIFSILSEESGLLGSLFVFVLFLIILLRIVFIIRNTKNVFGYYIASGILIMFFFHFVVNVGMVMGIMPITGIPLLFLSYGGSSLWTAMWATGLLMSIHYRRLDFDI